MEIKKYLFVRQISIPSIAHFSGESTYPQFVSVEGYNRTHAVERLVARFPSSQFMDWDFIDELDPEHFVGRLGFDLPMRSEDLK